MSEFETQPSEQEIYLLGPARLQDYVTFVRQHAAGGTTRPEHEIIDEWRDAALAWRELENDESQADVANSIRTVPMPPDLMTQAVRQLENPAVLRTFGSIPISIGMVELDKLLVYQHDISLANVERIKAALGPEPSAQRIFDICMPKDPAIAETVTGYVEGDQYEFHSTVHDMRFLGSQLVDPDAVTGLQFAGVPAKVIAVAVGYSANYLNVIRYGARMGLNNGYHRAYALRALGIKYAPCVIRVAAHGDEISFGGSGEFSRNSDYFFGSARPPMLADFFDERFVRHVERRPARKFLRVSIESERRYMMMRDK